MRILLLCEGPNENVLINQLLDADALYINRDNLIGRRPFPIRQLKSPFIISELKHNGEKVKVYRIGDTQKDKLTIPEELKRYISKDQISKYCTKPELEMLLILNENMEKEYEKVKKKETPKEFAKRNIKYNGKRYNQSSEFLEMYFGGNNIHKLVNCIKKYKSYKKHKSKTELYLADLLKK